ncbi:Rrf2 family transcriptional regulator [Arenibacter sp. F26102]|uniref:RrF2 family transcriptional regulator n=1 Tax=Arenibacter sp. F26102 TaxID=2926416 RepID=UPI001FF34B86|nr:Rrf2 family transcriptional regulator [Arenibacter sp. F26102]MCK0144774.1 Rrf2 family transcriptional regulator [Arenibacter sp. F26102]
MFSKACEYGIKATIYIAVKSMHQERVSLKEIAEEVNSPVAFTAKILQSLAKSGIIDSHKGPTGGFQIEESRIDIIKLHDIVHAIDGDDIFNGCGLGLKQCDARQPCPVHHKFVVIRDNLKIMLQNTSLYELASGLDIGLTHLKR